MSGPKGLVELSALSSEIVTNVLSEFSRKCSRYIGYALTYTSITSQLATIVSTWT